MDNHQRQYLRPLKRNPGRRPLAAFDTEGTGEPGKFVCGAVVSDKGRYIFTHPGDMLSYLCSPELRNYWLWAHNLEYDLSVMTGGDLTPFSILFTDTHILWAETQDPHGHRWRFCDSLNIFPGQSVADLGRLVGLRKVGLPDSLHAHLRRGTLLVNLPKDDQDFITAYCLRDAEIVWQALELLQEELLSLGGKLQATIAGTSMDLFRRAYLAAPWPTPDEGINELARLGYYGARTEPYKLGKVANVNGYDINSLYPSEQGRIQFPDPNLLRLEIAPYRISQTLDRPGLSLVRIYVPDVQAPPLPCRVGHHLYFPTGTLQGVWPHNELLHALEQGARIDRVDWSLTSDGSFNPFAPFIEDLYRRRMLHASDGDMRVKTFKLLLNSAYGRYGVNPNHPLSVLLPLPPDPDWGKYQGGEIRMIADRPYVLMPTSNNHQPAYCNVPIAAYITAAGRIRMHQEITYVVDDLVYTDTDSLFVTGEKAVGSGLGEMKQTHHGVDLWCVAPKEYAVFSGEHLQEVKAKGVPEAHRLLYLKTGRAIFDRPLHIREAARFGLSPASWVKQLRQRRLQVPKRSPDFFHRQSPDHYLTRPWQIGELVELVGSPHLLSHQGVIPPMP